MQDKQVTASGRFWTMAILIAVLILVDQFSKGYFQSNYALGESRPVIEGLFNFTYAQNTGAAFGMGQEYHKYVRYFMFLFIPTGAVLWLFYLLFTSLRGPYIRVLAYSLIIAGAIGNLIDRYALGYVVDFFHFYHKDWHFAVFNVADSCITVAAFLLGIDFLINPHPNKKNKDGKNKAEKNDVKKNQPSAS
ncbi:signal peptidase II [Bacteriovoracaceae bacterium]|nr:signal peptidase II [Bacteriovoracaceae bacterium]